MASKEDLHNRNAYKAFLAKNPKKRVQTMAGLGKTYRGHSTKEITKEKADLVRSLRARDKRR